MATSKQAARQGYRDRGTGQYAKTPKCQGCGKAVDILEYASHPMTDCTGDDGRPWGDTAIRLCDRCYSVTDHMRNVAEFIIYRDTGWY